MKATHYLFHVAAVTIMFTNCQVEAVTLLSTPTQTRSSSEFSPGFSEERLFDGPILVVDIGTTNNTGTDYAGSGNGPHTIYMELAGSEQTNGFVYAQRLGGIPTVDKVGTIELWFEGSSGLPLADNSGFEPPVGPADETITGINLTSRLLVPYNITTSYDARFVFMRLSDGNGFNPGGAEFRFTNTVPEPATASLAMLGLAGLVMRRRRTA